MEVGVLGATGMVGQQFMSRLAGHPWFDLTWLAASERSEGKVYADAAPWRLSAPMPEMCRTTKVDACTPGKGPKVVFSALDAAAADTLEAEFAAAGHIVLSNARSHRMDPLVPLLIPEVNAGSPVPDRRAAQGEGLVRRDRHESELRRRRARDGARAAAAVRPPTRCMVTTMQAVSGAGYPGVPSLDILGNVIPFIGGGEEEKIETETLKILGRDGGRTPYPAIVSAHVNRVPVIDGHTMTVSVELERDRPSVDAVIDAHAHVLGQAAGAEAADGARCRRSSIMTEPNRPQPRLDAGLGDGMAVSVGRVRPCPVLTHKFVALGHNTIRGAAGASILNAELMQAEGLLA